jgi:ATP-dependent DNA helicase RecQ
VIQFIQRRDGESGIVYCASRAATERVAQALIERGITALPYHAGMEGDDRHRHQERFIRDESRVICATIAFGMGINKPNVRWVIHHDLPKNLESYYQETGRAGRDGLPADCLLLYSAGDVAKQQHFIGEMSDPGEQQVARRQLQTMLHFAETARCRRAEVLGYFGETFPSDNCGGCDNCLEPRETFDGTIVAQKFLSCVFRIKQSSGFAVGMNHVIEVLTGADTEKIRKWGHTRLSTYGIGAELSRSQWAGVGRELLRLGLVAVSQGEFATLEVTAEGGAALRARQPITLTKPMEKPAITKRAPRRSGEIACDETLFEQLRKVRKRLADERSVPAYIICGDVTLRELARFYPTTLTGMESISGFGAKKLADFGELFARTIAEHLANHSRMEFRDA